MEDCHRRHPDLHWPSITTVLWWFALFAMIRIIMISLLPLSPLFLTCQIANFWNGIKSNLNFVHFHVTPPTAVSVVATKSTHFLMYVRLEDSCYNSQRASNKHPPTHAMLVLIQTNPPSWCSRADWRCFQGTDACAGHGQGAGTDRELTGGSFMTFNDVWNKIICETIHSRVIGCSVYLVLLLYIQ